MLMLIIFLFLILLLTFLIRLGIGTIRTFPPLPLLPTILRLLVRFLEAVMAEFGW